MNTQAGFIFKILFWSAVLSFSIKYGGQYLALKPTTSTALAIVLLPSLIIGFNLGWRYFQ